MFFVKILQKNFSLFFVMLLAIFHIASILKEQQDFVLFVCLIPICSGICDIGLIRVEMKLYALWFAKIDLAGLSRIGCVYSFLLRMQLPVSLLS